jgi:hypothetical protein
MVSVVRGIMTDKAACARRWNPSDLPKWLDEDSYRREILPRLSALTVKTIRTAIDVSHPYATLIKRGQKIPHPRHWMSLAGLTSYSESPLVEDRKVPCRRARSFISAKNTGTRIRT